MNTDSAFDNLSHSAAITLLKRLYGVNDEIDDIIENHLEAAEDVKTDGDGLYQSLHRQLKQIEVEDSYIEYYEVAGFSCRLQSLLLDIDTLLREQNPAMALDLLSGFLNMVEPIVERVDDSGGEVGGVFDKAIDQWLDTAVEVRAMHPGYLDWVRTVVNYFDHNDYGCLDGFISRSAVLLTEGELRQLAQDFEQQARAAIKSAPANKEGRSSYNLEAAHACIGLRSVAEALGDMSLFEQATTLISPTPNTLQMESLVNYAITIGEYARADYWLSQPAWDERDYQHHSLNCRLLEAQGKNRELKQALKNYFEAESSLFSLKPYWKICNATERKRLRAKVEKQATLNLSTEDKVKQSIELLLFIGNHERAEEVLVAHAACVSNMDWTELTGWAETFDKGKQTLAAIICYRGLLNDILQRGYTKAYHHAASYFHKLLELDKRVRSYKNLDDSASYIRQVQQQHWRKRSFWAEADYPNKTG